MESFLKETLTAIKESGHKESDVMFIGSDDGEYRISLIGFKEIANFSYDSGFGGQEIAANLIIYLMMNGAENNTAINVKSYSIWV